MLSVDEVIARVYSVWVGVWAVVAVVNKHYSYFIWERDHTTLINFIVC